MKRLLSLLIPGAVLCGSGAWAGDDIYRLGFDGPAELVGQTGETVGDDYFCTLSHEGSGPGAQGFSLSFTADGGTITSITFAGTDTEDVFSGGFSQGGLTSGAGNEGAVFAVVLCFGCPNVLPDDATIALFGLECVVGEEDHTVTLRYVDGLQGPGQPVENVATQEGQSFPPEVASMDVLCKKSTVVDCCEEGLNFGFSTERVDSDTPWAGIEGHVGPPDESHPVGCSADGAVVEINSPQTNVYLNAISQLEGDGVQGWSSAIAVDGPVGVLDVTIDNTAGAPAPEGRFMAGFGSHARILPEDNGGQEGVVSAIVLCFGCPETLRLTGTESITNVTVGPAAELSEEPQEILLRLQDGLIGPGQPVNNVLTILGNSNKGCNQGATNLTLSFVGAPGSFFVRGNANNDDKVNIADPIWIVSELFRGGPESPCQDAADANANGILELGDATMLINYLFLSGSAPSAPFPSCPAEPIEDVLGCTTSPACP